MQSQFKTQAIRPLFLKNGAPQIKYSVAILLVMVF
jgi:hypothetical protein